MEVNCKNCQKLFVGDFCPDCGQRVINHRFTVKESITWLFSSIFNLEKGFLHTTWALIKTPGKVISDFTKGITMPYAHPFRFIFVWATVSTLISVYTGAFDEMGKMGMQMNDPSAAGAEFGEAYLKVFKQYMSVFYMILIPFFSICTSLFYRKHKLYFAEHLILNSYSQGISIAVGLPVMLMYLIIPHEYAQALGVVSMLLGLFMVSYVYSRFFKENMFLSILKYFFSFLITIVLIMIVAMIGVVIHILLIKFAGFENVYETFKQGVEAAEAVKVK